ncbi:uncharacterized protein LOC123703104 [Colias croceus]|uniref:uncharacterized protein LOC123703104 n=1 Tax=Colias crocea TaxID=72248 RepID=UPI001E27AC4F|nr:uncharacterized protein LOC123703104 [Colias croceus]
MNEDIVNSNRIMVADKNGNVYIPDDRQIRNNENIQQIVTAVPSKSNTRKKVKNVTKWKRVAAKIARLKGSPYHSTVAKKNPEIDGREMKPPCKCKSKCYEKVPNETRIQIFDEFWKKCSSWDQRRQFIASNVTKKQKHTMRTTGNLDTDRRKFTYEYRLIVNSKSEKICRNMFLHTLSIGEKFVKVSLEKQLDGGLVAPDQRGKHIPGNKTSDVVVQSVMDHINSYPCYESHYSLQIW